MYMHGCDSWCFQSSYNLLHLLLSHVVPLICHTTRLTKSEGHEWSLPHWSREGLHLHIQNIRSLSRHKRCPQRWSYSSTWRVKNSHHFFLSVGLFYKKNSAYPLIELPKGKEGSSHLPSTWSFNQPKNMTWPNLVVSKKKIYIKLFSQGKYPSNIHGCKALRCLSHQLRASTQTCNPSATCQSAKLLLMDEIRRSAWDLWNTLNNGFFH